MTSLISDYELDPANKFKEQLRRTNIYVLDVETYKTDTFDGKELMGVAIGIPSGIGVDTFYFSPAEFAEIHDLLQGKEMIGFSLMFDLEILEQNGYSHEGFVWDVLVMAHLCNENEFNYSLDYLSQKYLKTNKGVLWGDKVVDINKLEDIYGWNEIPFVFMSTYAQQDVSLTWQLYLRVRAELEKQELMKVYRASSRYVIALQHLVQEGLQVDWDLLDVMSKEAQAEMDELEAFVGFRPSKRKQLEDLLYSTLELPVVKVTKNNQRAQDKGALERLIRSHPEHARLLRSVLRWRNLQKAQSTWYDGFRTRRTQRGRIHPGLKQHGTVTGRLSCAEPNLQQIPRDGERVKRLFTDILGHVLVEFDWAGVELRLGSHYARKLGNDSRMFELLRGGLDAHTDTANEIGVFDQIADSKMARDVGKTGNFSWIYGVGPQTFTEQLFNMYGFECTTDQAFEWTEAFHRANPGFRRAAARYATYHQHNGYVETWHRRRMRIRSVNARGQVKHYIAFNRIVQGGVGALLMEATVRISDAIKRQEIDARMCLSVHDSLWFYIPEDSLDRTTEQIIDIMEGPASKRWDLPFTVEPKALNHRDWEWKEGTWQVHQRDSHESQPSTLQPEHSTSSICSPQDGIESRDSGFVTWTQLTLGGSDSTELLEW